MAAIGQFPPVMGRRLGGRVGTGLAVTAGLAIVLAVGFDLSAIASIGSVIALLVFGLISVGHLRVRARDRRHEPWILVLAVASTVIVLVSFVFTTLVDEPGTAVALVVILLVSVVARRRVEAIPDSRRRHLTRPGSVRAPAGAEGRHDGRWRRRRSASSSCSSCSWAQR